MWRERLSVFASAAGGMLLGFLAAWTWRDSPAPSAPVSRVEGVSELASAARMLQEEIRALRAERLQPIPGLAESAARPAEPSASVPTGLEESLHALNARLDALAASIERMGASASASRFFPKLERIDRPVDTRSLDELRETLEVERDLSHLGWTYQQVLDQYGQPTRIGPSPNGVGTKWYYELPSGDVLFWFLDDRLVKLFCVE